MKATVTGVYWKDRFADALIIYILIIYMARVPAVPGPLCPKAAIGFDF